MKSKMLLLACIIATIFVAYQVYGFGWYSQFEIPALILSAIGALLGWVGYFKKTATPVLISALAFTAASLLGSVFLNYASIVTALMFLSFHYQKAQEN